MRNFQQQIRKTGKLNQLVLNHAIPHDQAAKKY